MPQTLKLSVSGLYTHPNPLDPTSRPPGALAIAENVVIDRENIAESRRGTVQYSNVEANVQKLFNFGDDFVVFVDDDFKLDNAGTFTTINVAAELSNSFSGPGSELPRSVQANENLYLTTNQGVIKLDNPTGSLVRSGAPRGLDLQAILATGTFLSNNTAVAYRLVWGYTDDNNNLILGAPSPRAEVNNTSGVAKGVSLNFTVPPGITTDWFYQIYRSLPSVAANVPGDDQLQLAVQAQYVSGTTITVTDNTADSALGAALYTNTTQDGPLAANDRAPMCTDICSFLDMTLYANVTFPESIVMTFNQIPSVNVTVTIDSQVYTAKATENVAAREFDVTGTTLEETVQSLTRCVNRNANSNVRAVHLFSGSFFTERVDFGASFSVNASSSVFNEALPATSWNRRAQNGVWVSKSGTPEAVPSLSSFFPGRADKPILRIFATRDAVFILKEDGIWRLMGTDPGNLALEAHDTTYEIVAPEVAALLDNNVFCASTKGIISISVSGVAVISRSIEKDILRYISFANFKTLAWACSYTSDRKFIIGFPSLSTYTEVDKLYVFNSFTGAWTQWVGPWRHALVKEEDDKLYVVRSSDERLLQERKAFSILDYADDEFSVMITGSNATTYVVTLSNAANAVIGQTLKQNTATAVLTDVNLTANTITLEANEFTWSNAAAKLYDPIPVKLQWVEESGENPGIMKMFTEMTMFFEQARFREISLRVTSNFKPSAAYSILRAKTASAWGSFLWGSVPWSTRLGVKQAIRTFLPRDVVRALWISVEIRLNQAFNKFGLSGASIIMNPMSTRFK